MVDLSKRAIDGLITFLYYGDLDKAEKFYREAMGLELAIDQGWAKIFKLAENAHVGLVDGNRGYHKPSPTKPVMITVLVPDVDAWYIHFKELGIPTLTEPKDDNQLKTRMFLLKDPEGYVIEIQHFY